MAVTLQEYMRLIQQLTPTMAGVLQTYRENAPILGEGINLGYPLPALRFENTVGRVGSFVRQKSLPNTGFRALNNPFPASEGVTEKIEESLSIGGGRVVIDRALIRAGGQDGVVTQMTMQTASFARVWNNCFYNGLSSDPNAFAGLSSRISGAQLLDNGGEALSLTLLDEALLQVRGGNRVIVMGTAMAARLFNAAKMSVNVNYTPETFGVSPATYNGVPIMLAGEKVDQSEVLDFTEDDGTTSIYVLSLDESGIVGIQSAPLEVIYDDPNKVDSSFEIEWDASFVIKNPRSAYRIKNIINEAITPAGIFYGKK